MMWPTSSVVWGSLSTSSPPPVMEQQGNMKILSRAGDLVSSSYHWLLFEFLLKSSSFDVYLIHRKCWLQVETFIFTELLPCYYDISVCPNEAGIERPWFNSSVATCILSGTCTGVKCCISVPRLSLSIEAYVEINPCNKTLQVGIENLRFNRSLYGYKFGEHEQFDLYGYVVIE